MSGVPEQKDESDGTQQAMETGEPRADVSTLTAQSQNSVPMELEKAKFAEVLNTRMMQMRTGYRLWENEASGNLDDNIINFISDNKVMVDKDLITEDDMKALDGSPDDSGETGCSHVDDEREPRTGRRYVCVGHDCPSYRENRLCARVRHAARNKETGSRRNQFRPECFIRAQRRKDEDSKICCNHGQDWDKFVYCKETANKGFALYSRSMWPPGTVLVEYTGVVISEQAQLSLMAEGTDKASYIVQLAGPTDEEREEGAKKATTVKRSPRPLRRKKRVANEKEEEDQRERLFIDAMDKGSLGRYANHSHSANCCFQTAKKGRMDVIVIKSMYWLHPGEEITVDYHWTAKSSQPEARIECHCGAANCSKRLYDQPEVEKERAEKEKQRTLKVRDMTFKEMLAELDGKFLEWEAAGIDYMQDIADEPAAQAGSGSGSTVEGIQTTIGNMTVDTASTTRDKRQSGTTVDDGQRAAPARRLSHSGRSTTSGGRGGAAPERRMDRRDSAEARRTGGAERNLGRSGILDEETSETVPEDTATEDREPMPAHGDEAAHGEEKDDATAPERNVVPSARAAQRDEMTQEEQSMELDTDAGGQDQQGGRLGPSGPPRRAPPPVAGPWALNQPGLNDLRMVAYGNPTRDGARLLHVNMEAELDVDVGVGEGCPDREAALWINRHWNEGVEGFRNAPHVQSTFWLEGAYWAWRMEAALRGAVLEAEPPEFLQGEAYSVPCRIYAQMATATKKLLVKPKRGQGNIGHIKETNLLARMVKSRGDGTDVRVAYPRCGKRGCIAWQHWKKDSTNGYRTACSGTVVCFGRNRSGCISKGKEMFGGIYYGGQICKHKDRCEKWIEVLCPLCKPSSTTPGPEGQRDGSEVGGMAYANEGEPAVAAADTTRTTVTRGVWRTPRATTENLIAGVYDPDGDLALMDPNEPTPVAGISPVPRMPALNTPAGNLESLAAAAMMINEGGVARTGMTPAGDVLDTPATLPAAGLSPVQDTPDEEGRETGDSSSEPGKKAAV